MPEFGLVIEVDGRSHDGAADADAKRQAFLESKDLTVLRFSNDEVLRDLEGVVARIAAWLNEKRAALSTHREAAEKRDVPG